MYGTGTDFRFPLKELSMYLDHSLSMSILENNRICDNRIGKVEYFIKKVVIDTVRPRDTRPQAARTSTMHGFE